jgi:glycosyltransferase involved in cell wall biosynthesis
MISVIIPTYNRPNLIGRSLESVLGQTFKELEIIVVDGSNNDETRRIISRYSDQRINYLKIKNISAAHSRNIGIHYAKGDYVSFNDDDDIWCDDKIERQLAHFKDKVSTRVVYSTFCKTIGKRTRKSPDRTVLTKCGNIFDEVLTRNFVGLPTIMLPLSCCQNVMFDENLRCLEDWDWVIRLAKLYEFQFIDDSLVMASSTPLSVNKSNYHIKAASYKIIFDKHYLDIKIVPNKEAKHLLSIGNNLCLSGNVDSGRNYLFEAMKLDSTNFKLLAGYLLSFMGVAIYRSVFKIFERLTNSQP